MGLSFDSFTLDDCDEARERGLERFRVSGSWDEAPGVSDESGELAVCLWDVFRSFSFGFVYLFFCQWLPETKRPLTCGLVDHISNSQATPADCSDEEKIEAKPVRAVTRTI